jgi:hypothetical protein
LGCPVKVDPPRLLNDDERAVLSLLLQPEFSGVEELRRQVAGLRVIWQCDCGCPTINFQIAGDAPSAAFSEVSPVELRVSPEGGEPTGDIILFLKNAQLSSLEYVYYTDQPPDRWPMRDRLSTFELP